MRLLHTSTLKFREFFGDDIPKYAILSHTWGEEEVSFQKLQQDEPEELDKLRGYRKIKDCCKLADSDGFPYVWIDTCCIDQTSSADHSEAINSMYRWYEGARICYAYLVDVDSSGLRKSSLAGRIGRSRWFTRGWTLQELLAPNHVVFYDKPWVEIGTRSTLSDQISKTTGIKHDHMFRPLRASVAAKMSWASGRTTTRIEDIAYSLMGLFEVNMPLLYGEGRKAFTRLQHEIVKISDDESIFAWLDKDAVESGAFARSPSAFAQSGDLVSVKFPHLERPPYTVTHRGLAIELALMPGKGVDTDGADHFQAALQCASAMDLAHPVLIELTSINQRDWIRTSPNKLIFSKEPLKDHKAHDNKLVYIKPTDKHASVVGTNQAPKFYVKTFVLRAYGFNISETFQCQPQLSFWDKEQREECWMVEMNLQHNLAALLLKSDNSKYQESIMIFLIASSTPQMDVLIPTRSETLAEIAENKSVQNDRYEDLFWTHGRHKFEMMVELRRRDAGCLIDVAIFKLKSSTEY